jgi:hypothetical protein
MTPRIWLWTRVQGSYELDFLYDVTHPLKVGVQYAPPLAIVERIAVAESGRLLE